MCKNNDNMGMLRRMKDTLILYFLNIRYIRDYVMTSDSVGKDYSEEIYRLMDKENTDKIKIEWMAIDKETKEEYNFKFTIEQNQSVYNEIIISNSRGDWLKDPYILLVFDDMMRNIVKRLRAVRKEFDLSKCDQKIILAKKPIILDTGGW